MERGRQISCLMVFLIAIERVDGVSTISENRRPVKTFNLTLTCRDDGPITQQVNFLKDSLLRGGCSPGCGTGVTGYSVSQNITGRETYLTISSLEQPRDCGNWTCNQGTDPDSPTFVMECPLPCALDLSTDITVTPPVSSLTSAENISVQVSVSCCSQAATIKWTYTKPNGLPEPLLSNSTTESSSCTGGDKQTLNTFQPLRSAFPTSGKITLTLSIEHDSFNPPDYTVVYTKEIDLGDTTTLPTPPTTSNNTNGSSACRLVSPWSLEISLLVIAGLMYF